jgi:hypothetical protein
MGKLESPFVVHVLVWIGHDGLEVLGAALASAFPALPRPKLLPAPALALTIAERPLGAKRSRSMSHSFVKWDYLFFGDGGRLACGQADCEPRSFAPFTLLLHPHRHEAVVHIGDLPAIIRPQVDTSLDDRAGAIGTNM